MVARVRSLTSSSSTAEYFHEEGGYYVTAGGDREAARAKAEEHRQASAWHGKAAAAVGLEPGRKVSAGAFERLLQGYVPGTGIRLGRKRDGKHEHRPGFDITFSAPKSVSLAALLPTAKHPRGDRAVLRCHDEAVRAALDWIEETMLQTRGWDPETRRRPRVKGHGLAAALFRHVASRDLDPQLHTHAVVANMTRDAEGRWKSIEPTLLHRHARLIGAYYRNELSRRLIERGYSVVPAMAGRLQSFEIAGYDKKLRDAFSTRRKAILAFIDEKGWERGEAEAQIAALATRKPKAEPLHGMLREIWADRASAFREVPGARRSRGRTVLPPVPTALEIAWRSVRHLEERQSVFAASDLEALALQHSPGRHSIEAVREAIGMLVRDAHLVEADLRRADRAFVTDRALKAERAVLAMMRAGIGAGAALCGRAEVEAHLAGAVLTDDQADAVRTVLLAEDRVVGVQGRAGTGKTGMLAHVRELAGGRFVLGLAPSSAAAATLARETGMHARTLQWFLARCGAPGSDGRPAIEHLKERFAGAVLVLDEASMVSTDQMRFLLQHARDLDIARLVLVGDRSQLRAVEAGQPFRLLQRAGMTTAVMEDIRRQRNPDLRKAVNAVLAGEPGEAVELLGGSVHEAPYEELAEKAGEAWLELGPEARERTLLVAPTHELRAGIDAVVREALAAEGVLRGRALRIERLVSLGMTRAEKADARNYREGDTVLFNQDMVNFRVKRDEALTVTGTEEDRVLLLHPDGRPRRIAPQEGYYRYRLEVYETREIEIRAGDRIRWTRNDKRRELVNGGRAEVAAITKDRVRFALEDGRSLSLRHGDPQLRHLDHAWSSTVHGAQGSTADGVIAVLDSGHGSLTDQSTFYVEISRARDSAVVLTDNREQLVEVLEAHTGERATALEAVGEEIDPEALRRRLAEKGPVWTPRGEWTRLEAMAREEGTVAFLAEGYDALVGRTEKLANWPNLPAAVREVVDGLLAYDRACREGDGLAHEFLGLLDAHEERRRALEERAAAEGAAAAGMEDWADWRAMAERLARNGRLVLEALGACAGEAGARIAACLDRFDALLLLDDTVPLFEALHREVEERARAANTIPFYAEGHDELLELARALAAQETVPPSVMAAVNLVIAGAETGEERRAAVVALIDEAGRLSGERARLEDLAAGEPPPLLGGYAAWLGALQAAAGRWRGMAEDADAWRPHLDRRGADAAALPASLERLGALADRDAVWARLHARRRALGARAGSGLAFHVAGWEAFVAEVRAFAERSGLPEAAAAFAAGVLEEDRLCRERRADIDGFFEDARRHDRDWKALDDERSRLGRRGRDMPLSDLSGYAGLSERARTLRRTGGAIAKDEGAYGPHLDRVRDGRKRLASELERLEKQHGPLDEFVRVMKRLDETRRDAAAEGLLPFHDDAHGAAIAEAGELEKNRELEEAARRRLRAELDEHAARAAEWARIEALRQEMKWLAGQDTRLSERAARARVPETLLPRWPARLERSERFEEAAGAALDDPGLKRHWDSRPEARDRIGEGLRAAERRRELPEIEEGRIADMIRAETRRLREPDAECRFGRRWRVGGDLVAGDRVRLRRWRGGTESEAAVHSTGRSGGRSPRDMVELEWVTLGRGHKPEEAVEAIPARMLSAMNVHPAEWSHAGLRDAALARQRSQPSDAFPVECRHDDIAAGDLLSWTELVEPALEERRRLDRAEPVEAVRFEGELLRRTAEEKRLDDRCTVEVTWRSDGRPCGERQLPLAALTGRGCWRALWREESRRRTELRVQTLELRMSRRLLLEQGRHMSIRL